MIGNSDERFMREALKQATQAYEIQEIPVGAVVVANGRIIAKAHNQTQLLTDVTAHAEILAITAASNNLGSKYLQNCTMYITLEPCIMCAGALFWSQIGRVVIGARDLHRGFIKKGEDILHPKTKLEIGVLEDECSTLVTEFFKTIRK